MTTPQAARLRFASATGLQRAMRERVDRYFRMTGQRPRDAARMYLKTGIVLAWTVASYVLLVFYATAWWQAVPLAVSLGLATAAIGFNIQHDASHGAYSRYPWVNRLLAFSLDMVGASSYVWARKHNTWHHTYTNIQGHDDDIDLGAFGRAAPEQPRRSWHRLQHLYLWVLYMFLPLKWQWHDDFSQVARGRIGLHPLPRPRGLDLALFVFGKLAFFGYALILPLALHAPGAVIGLYFLACFVQGLVISIVFQLAHVVEEAHFPMPATESGRMEDAWAEHQIATTVDFAPRNRLVSWFVGGLNFQVEHHLFPRICHVHYPAIARIVERVCRDHGVTYRAHPTLRGAIRSHYRWLKAMGRPVAA